MLVKMRAQAKGDHERVEQKTIPKGAVMRVIVTWRSNETKTQDYAPPRPTVAGDNNQNLRLHGGLAPRCGNRVLAHGQARPGNGTTKTGCSALWPGAVGNLFKWVIAQRYGCEDSFNPGALEDRSELVILNRRGSLFRGPSWSLVSCVFFLFQTATMVKDLGAACALPGWYDPERGKRLKPVTDNAVASAAYRSWGFHHEVKLGTLRSRRLNRKSLLTGG